MKAQKKQVFPSVPETVGVILFGSYAKGTAREESDMDFAILTERDLERPEKLIPHLGETPPQLGETIPHLGETIPQLGETIPHLGETIPQLGETIPHLGETIPQLGETIPHLRETVPRMGKRSPYSRGSRSDAVIKFINPLFKQYGRAS